MMVMDGAIKIELLIDAHVRCFFALKSFMSAVIVHKFNIFMQFFNHISNIEGILPFGKFAHWYSNKFNINFVSIKIVHKWDMSTARGL